MNDFVAATQKAQVLFGVVHLKPLPGSPGYSGGGLDGIARLARQDAEAIIEAGFDGYVLENFGDVPFYADQVPAHVVAAMTRVALELPRRGVLVGVNVLRNDAMAALSIAAACDLEFVRINVHTGAMLTDQGIVEGRAAVTVRERQRLAPEVAILADVLVKHATPLGSDVDIQSWARDTAYRGLADALIVTGKATGAAASLDDLQRVRSAVPDRPILVGSGVTPKTLRDTLRHAHGVIVGSAIKHAGLAENPVDPARAREFVREARR